MVAKLPRLIACLLLVLSTPSLADTSAGSSAETPSWRLGIAAGYGERSNPLVGGENLTLYADLDIAWFGDRWFFDNGDLGYTLIDRPAATVNVIARANSDRLFFSRTSGPVAVIGLTLDAPDSDPDFSPTPEFSQPLGAIELEPPERSWALESGFEILQEGRWGFLQASFLHDVSGVHNGYEAALSYGYGLVVGRLYLEPSLALAYKSNDMNDYYWGIRGDETPAGTSGYTAGAGLNSMARFSASYRINAHFGASMAIEYERLNDDARRSPIVRRGHVLGFFAGLAYRF